MLTIEAKNKICPINQQKCVVENCPKWKFTKTNHIYTYTPDAVCRCGQGTTPYKLCWECGEVATPERVIQWHSKEMDLGVLPYENQEGECTL
jgi:hypothetical protein